MVPPRADLPEGTPNYVTQNGLKELEEEKKLMEDELENLDPSNEKERRIASNHIHATMQLLEERIVSAQLIKPEEQAKDEVRFGATIGLKIGDAQKVEESLQNKGFRVVSDLRNEKIGFKIREHTIQKVPYLLVVGDKEVESQSVAVRARHGEDLGSMDLEAFISHLTDDVACRGRIALESQH